MHTVGVNKVTLLGNCTAEPDVRYYPNGSAVTTITIATSEKWIDRNSGERKEATEWHHVTFRDSEQGRVGEKAGDELYKGAKVYVEGRLKTRSWEGRAGKRHKLEILGKEFELLSKAKEKPVTHYPGSLAALL